MTTLTDRQLFCCRIAPLAGPYVLISRQHTRYNPICYSVHPLMADGLTVGASGQTVTAQQVTDMCPQWDDITDYRIG